jgi:hypothetical protein
MDTDTLELCLRALKAARPYVLEGKGPFADSAHTGRLVDEALSKLGEPQDDSEWH